ncbi:glycosyltransferase family 4 protein [Endozoicomonas sp. SESOKO1]|uniref:glycosyltransferase family 4 protein n=1 Tax=Endozoicomonas sp. SESOKO1 TaxID=2828742 RepID=UPI002148A14D|nr:glycosyltransferase family 4 protein [Endozoicomonas sp. SESOKO1]
MIDKKPLAVIHHSLINSGGMERYAFDLITGLLHHTDDLKIVSRKIDRQLVKDFNNKLTELPTSIFTPQKLKNRIFAHKVIKSGLLDSCLTIGPARIPGIDIAIVGGTHMGHILNAKNGRTSFWDRLELNSERSYYQQAKLIIAHSDLMKEELIDLYNVPECKIRVIYPPVDTTRFNLDNETKRDELRTRFGFEKDEIVFLFPSSSHKRKGLDLISPLFMNSTLPIVLAVAGSPVDCQSNNIRYLGRLDNIEEAYSAADYTILASSYEPFGLVGPESVLCGTPIVLSENIACSQTIKQAAKITFDRECNESITAAMQEAIKRHKAGEHRLEEPLQHLMYQPMIDSHVQQILECVKQI